MEKEDMEQPDSLGQSSQQKYRTTSVCFKLKFDALEENVTAEEQNFIVVHEMYQCSKCYKIFNEESALSDHECIFQEDIGSQDQNISAGTSKPECRLFKKKYSYDCDQCDLSFSQKVMLRKHRQTHKSKRAEFACVPCSLEFADKDSLLQHRRSHFKEKWFKCDQCDKRFAYEKLLDWHYRRQHLTPKVKFVPQCEICDKIFSNRANLRRHRSLHNLPNSERFTCEICLASFPLKAYLKNHSATHSQERPFMCDKCGKTFKKQKDLTKHSITHEPKASQPKRRPRQSKSRNFHSYKYTCEKCGKRYATKYGLDLHRLIHTDEKPHKCEICSKTFRHKLLLKNHLFVHSDVRFTCDICDKQYASKGSYQKHLKLHNDAEAIPCDACDMKFSSKSALVTHYVVHSKEKPYECDLCHRSYSQKGSLNKHPCSQAAAKSTAEILLNLISRNENCP